MTSKNMHALNRTSPKGGPFIGTCYLCGKADLPSNAIFEPCENPANLNQDETLLIAIDDGSADHDQ